jgi:WD40 repeat protein/nucleoside phosphorylase
MVGGIQSFDICIVCALAEEAEAVINEFSDRCKVHFKQAFSKINGYEYQHATIKNNKREPLTVLIMWMPFTGPIETVNSVRSLLEEFRPRFVAMTGICAGYREKVTLGDLVAAAYAFHYEEGKVEADENGQDRLRPEWRTHGTAKRIVQYINKFTAWETPVAEMKQRMIGRELEKSERPRCLIAPIASGMAVQGNNPFPSLLEHNRKALFVDQEVAALYQTLNEFPDIYFLAVKGVCDYGDKDKNDDYHEYAGRASAIYLLRFIQAYVTNTTMPPRDDHQSQNQAGPPYPQVGIQNNSDGDVNIKQSQVNVAGGNIIVNYPLFKGVGSRRLFLASLVGLAVTGGIAWFALYHRAAAIGSTPLGTLVYTYRGHSDLVTALTWSPDSIRIASASADQTVQVWNAADGGQVYVYRGHDDFVYAVAWSPDGRRIVSGSSDGTVRVWDAVSGARISAYKGSANAVSWWSSVAWSPDSTRIASGANDGTVQVWYAENGGQIYTYHGHADGVKSVAWSPDGTRIASGSSDGTVQVRNAADGKLMYTYLGHSGAVETVAWSPDSKRIASGGRDNTVQIWDAVDGGHVSPCRGHTSSVEGVAWSPDGKRIVSGSLDATVRIWNAADGRQASIYTGHSVSIDAVGWAPNGTCIASGDGFPQHGAIQVWGAGD